MEVARYFVARNGRRVSYLAAGGAHRPTSPTVLLIHGSGMSARCWTEQLRGLRPALRVVAIDLPGHGESDPIPEETVEAYADAARDLLVALGAGAVFVAGHSLGGAIAQALAGRHPAMVQGLVLISTCAKLPENYRWRGRLLWYVPGPFRRAIFFSAVRKVLFGPGAPTEAVRLGMEEIRSCPTDSLLKDVAAARAMDLRNVASGLRLPTLILCGSRDELTPSALSGELHRLVPGSRLHVIEGVGHMLLLEAPERVNQEILDFVESVRGRVSRRVTRAPCRTRRSIARRLLDAARAFLRLGPRATSRGGSPR